MKSASLIATLPAAPCIAGSQPLYQVPAGVETRWASPENPTGEKGRAAMTRSGRKGRPNFPLAAGESAVLAEVQGTSGTVRRIWMTLHKPTAETLRGFRIDMYWDGSARPAVSAPVGDFFGVGLGRMARFESELLSNPEGRSFNCFIPMPFRTGMKIVLTNESSKDMDMVFYDVNYTVGDPHGDDALYFHAWFNRENPTVILRDYTILPKVSGRGRFLGVNVGLIVNEKEYFNSWWGEGEVKMFLDGDGGHPTLCGTGTEDYAGSAWGIGEFAHDFTGCTVRTDSLVCFYRWHIPDPVYFHSDIRVVLQQIGLWTPESVPKFREAKSVDFYVTPDATIDWDNPAIATYGMMERRDDVSSCAYFYLDRPENGLPPLVSVEERLRDLPETN